MARWIVCLLIAELLTLAQGVVLIGALLAACLLLTVLRLCESLGQTRRAM